MSESEKQGQSPRVLPRNSDSFLEAVRIDRWEITDTQQYLGKGTHQIPRPNKIFQNFLLLIVTHSILKAYFGNHLKF